MYVRVIRKSATSDNLQRFLNASLLRFAEGVSKICAAYVAQSLTVRVDLDSPHFVRLSVTDPVISRTSKVELATDLRPHPPVTMEIDPVDHLEDVAGGKVEALFTRAEVRDFIDLDAFLTSGRLNREQLLDLAHPARALIIPSAIDPPEGEASQGHGPRAGIRDAAGQAIRYTPARLPAHLRYGCPSGSRKTRKDVPGWCACLDAPSSSTSPAPGRPAYRRYTRRR
jgi:hypothetical protein